METCKPEVQGPKSQHSELIEAYKNARAGYETLTLKVHGLLTELLASQAISIQLVEHRTKTVESLEEKVCRPGKNYDHQLSRLSDLAGVRVIAHYLDDIPKITELIKENFQVIEEESGDKLDLLDDDEFGYRSVHFVVMLRDDRLRLPEWRQFKEMKVEIQVRTVLQHAWADVSHALSYKHESDVARSLRRKLNRLSGLFELADEEFCELRTAKEELSVRSQNQILHDNYEVEITPDTLAQYIDHTGADGEFQNFAAEIGWTIVPFCHLSRYDDYVDLAGICDLVGMRKLVEFHEFIEEMKQGQAGVKILSDLETAFPGGWSASPLFIVQLLLIISRGAGVTYEQIMQRVDWDGPTAETAIEAAKAQRSA